MDFYNQLKPFSHFDQFVDDQFYVSVPEGHYAVVADIKGSTQAVKAGRYKEVNLVGAAVITSLITALKTDFPFVFGGDGASAIIHESQVETARSVLRSLAFHAAEMFDLQLIAGLVPVAELKATGYAIDIAKYQPAQRMPLAMFRGGGLQHAETLIKQDSQYQLQPAAELPRDSLFQGLTCRWQDIESQHGDTVTLLVAPCDPAQAAAQISTVVEQISAILGGSFDGSNPVGAGFSGYRSFLDSLREERKLYDHGWSLGYISCILELLFVTPIFKWGLYRYFNWSKRYINAVATHADFQKFDDMLRMVIDCSPEQTTKIKTLLESLQDQGKVVYGMQLSESAQMTCYVQGVGDGEHIHFIDGSNGGYTLAAVEMKKRLADIHHTSADHK